jgi:hypothetical protein
VPYGSVLELFEPRSWFDCKVMVDLIGVLSNHDLQGSYVAPLRANGEGPVRAGGLTASH